MRAEVRNSVSQICLISSILGYYVKSMFNKVFSRSSESFYL